MPKDLHQTYLLKKALIFDLFHTLICLEDSGSDFRATHEIIGVSRDDWERQLFSDVDDKLKGKEKNPFKIMEKMIRALKPTIEKEYIETALEHRRRRFEKAFREVPEVTMKSLKIFKEGGKKIGLISNADILEMTGWEESPLKKFIDIPIFSCQVGYMKPEKEIYELCMRELGVSKEECLFIGDGGSQELQGAVNMGIETVMITGFIEKRWPHLINERKKHACFVIKNLDELACLSD
ncbi:HAD family hydrolase [candidate division WOR-3 bacterium]|nr:HAD family hydrolase [candidate division WOR-3 bacterium]